MAKLYDVNPQAPFFCELQRSYTKGKDMININGKEIPRAIWNLILTKRDLSLYTKGMKVNRQWKVSDVKKYFGIKGSGYKLYEQFMTIHHFIFGAKGEKEYFGIIGTKGEKNV